MPTATVRLRGPDGERLRAAPRWARGRCDAAYRAIDEIVRVPSSLLEFSVHAVTEGIDALGEVSVRVRGGRDVEQAAPAARRRGAGLPRPRR